MPINTETLFDNAGKCSELASDANTPAADKKIYRKHAKKFRAAAMSQAVRDFDEDAEKISEANDKISEVNAKLKDRLDGLQNTASTIGALGELASILDDILNLIPAIV